MNKQPTVYYTKQVAVSSTAVLVLNYDKRRTAYTLTAITNDLVIGPDNTVTASNGLYLPVKVPIQFNLMNGFDTRIPMYAIRAGAADGTITIRVDGQEKETYEYDGV